MCWLVGRLKALGRAGAEWSGGVGRKDVGCRVWVADQGPAMQGGWAAGARLARQDGLSRGEWGQTPLLAAER